MISEGTFFVKLGSRVRQLREVKNLSQQDLANDCNIPKRQIGRIERAEINPTLKTLIKIANALELELKDLLDFPSK
ncbi:helix-turn-helix domain-containing protein [Flavobacterium hibisci]|uniref:helix-turn-helix domain-containing protein n=1 Tax=Flavobacterium hibisci TaxID=1914462 RepID=UPI001CC1127B|nr:helix-turn-helix transcriptional regulator [Flavobacterium hibisci]MBZ4044502.1 helix-turn-helix domain-containing protein [Flavobacterium hibisci]